MFSGKTSELIRRLKRLKVTINGLNLCTPRWSKPHFIDVNQRWRRQRRGRQRVASSSPSWRVHPRMLLARYFCARTKKNPTKSGKVRPHVSSALETTRRAVSSIIITPPRVAPSQAANISRMRRGLLAVALVVACAFVFSSETAAQDDAASSFVAAENSETTRPPPDSAFPLDPVDPDDPTVVESEPHVMITTPVILQHDPVLLENNTEGANARARLERDLNPNTNEEKLQEEVSATHHHGRNNGCHGGGSHCPPHEQITIGAGSSMPYPMEVPGVHAPQCLLDQPPTCTCFGPFTFTRPWGVYCVLVPADGLKPTPPPSPPPNNNPSPPPSPPPPPQEECGSAPDDFSCGETADGLNPCGFCIFVNGLKTCCCDIQCQIGEPPDGPDCCADFLSCCIPEEFQPGAVESPEKKITFAPREGGKTRESKAREIITKGNKETSSTKRDQ